MNWPGHKFAAVIFFSAIATWIVIMAALMRQSALPPEASGIMLAVFEPATPADEIFAKITRANAKPIRKTAFGFIWVVAGEEAGLAARLAAQGAIGTYRDLPISPTIAGCFAYADSKITAYRSP